MTNPGEVMAETPTLLSGLKFFPEGHGDRLLQGVSMLWERFQRDARKAGGAHPENTVQIPVYASETAALLKFVFSRNFDPAKSNYLGYELSRVVIATGDAELLDLWIRFGGKSLVGNLELIIALLEKDRITEATALAPGLGRGWSSSRHFDAHVESLVAKLRAEDSPQAVSLMIQLSLLYDASGDMAPVEKRSLRATRILEDFVSVRGSLSQADRAGVCLALGLNHTREPQHVPELDEFVNEEVAKEFKKMLLTGGGESAAAQLFIPAVCSRVCAEDLSGIALLAEVLKALPPGPRSESSILQTAVFPVHSALAAYASRLDGKLPPPSVVAILAYARGLAGRGNSKYQDIASQLVYLVSTDADSLAVNLGSCGLAVVKPSSASVEGRYSVNLKTLQNLIRVSLLHPTASEALLDSLGSPLNNGATTGALLPSLQEPALRARISPELFLKWNRDLRVVAAKDFEAMNLYVTERRAEFDDAQRTELDALLKRLGERVKFRDPTLREEMNRRQMEERRSDHEGR
jgi:hypothetical protein